VRLDNNYCSGGSRGFVGFARNPLRLGPCVVAENARTGCIRV